MDHFRITFWKEVAKDPVLSKSFLSKDLNVIKKSGKAPAVAESQQLGKLTSYVLHHINPNHNGGPMYDVDNLMIVTPRYHKEVLDPDFHFNRK